MFALYFATKLGSKIFFALAPPVALFFLAASSPCFPFPQKASAALLPQCACNSRWREKFTGKLSDDSLEGTLAGEEVHVPDVEASARYL